MTLDALLNVLGVGLGVSAISGIVALLVARMQRPKIEAEARKIDAETEAIAITNAEAIADQFERRFLAIEQREAACARRLDLLRDRVYVLERALRENDIPIPPVKES